MPDPATRTPTACLPPAVAAAGPLRRTARLCAVAVVLVAALPLYPVLCLAPATWRTRLVKNEARLLLRAIGVTVRLIIDQGGGASGGTSAGALIVANHVSWLDPLVLAATVPARPLAGRELRRRPIVGALAAAGGTLFIDGEDARAAVRAVARALRDGDTVIAFPEGAASRGVRTGAFRPAVFQAAIDADAVIRAAALRYHEGDLPSTRGSWACDDPITASLLRVVATRHLRAEVRVSAPLGPVPAGRPQQVRALLARSAESQVRAALA
ncbi:lysophospholipid acyltransferase family protein [Nonomuraea monospora]|uniref:Lysophospholipid acyltransferase family protein n=1 Tax=Nonomuraea monospora TaxID=568818 RepID=A0ABN3CWQ8_9ACTN